MTQENTRHAFPQTSTQASTVWVGLVCAALCFWLLIELPLFELSRQSLANADAATFLVIAVGLSMAVWEVLVNKNYRNPDANLGHIRHAKSTRRVFYKWLGLACTYAAMAFIYWLLPLYRQDFYKPFLEAASGLVGTMLFLAWPYLSWVDKRQEFPEQDAYFLIGKVLAEDATKALALDFLKLGKLSLNLFKAFSVFKTLQGVDEKTQSVNQSLNQDKNQDKNHGIGLGSSQTATQGVQVKILNAPPWICEHIRAWAVKLFFLPLMFGFICENLSGMAGWHFRWQDLSWVQQVEHLSVCIFMLDLLWGCVGYLWSLKICDSHIRSAEPTMLGWSVALAFYAPFNHVLGPNFFAYETNMKWHHWLAPYPEMSYAWGAALLALNLCFVWATVVFGLRFSNLTHRGIITSGPYRYCKHPAYICKNLSWWMVAMPFMVISTQTEALRVCLLLLLANLGYYLRAKTEERHMLQTCPDYALYCMALTQQRQGAWPWRVLIGKSKVAL